MMSLYQPNQSLYDHSSQVGEGECPNRPTDPAYRDAARLCVGIA